jgi:hydroxymethylpyrimidine pyrophosphatase-like HAD family hydrolase
MGIHIVLASGRPAHGLLPIARALELNNYGGYVISCNGAQIMDMQSGETIYEKKIDKDQIPYLYRKAKKNNFPIFTYRQDKIITDSPGNRHIVEEAALNNMEITSAGDSFAIDFNPH